MTNELQHVMARYEEARIEYRKAVLASLNGESTGEHIRQAIRDFQKASAELRRLTGATAPAGPPPARAANAPRPAEREFVGAALFRKLLSVG
jgi:hypothetical protein